MGKTYLINKFSMRLECADGTVKTREFREAVCYADFRASLFDFISSHIGHAFIFDDFSHTSIKWRFDDVQFSKSFENLEAMRNWYLSII